MVGEIKLLKYLDPQVLTTKLISYLPSLISAVILIFIFWVLKIIVRKMAAGALARTKIPQEVRNLLLNFINIGVIVIGALTVADQLGINITSLIAGVGIAGLAISFASQDTIANVISGIVIIIDRPFGEGDWISLGNLHASVTEIRLRTTVLTTFDNETVVVPNKQLAQERVVNYTITRRIRARVPVGISYKEDINQAREVMLNTLKGDDRILAEPQPVVVVLSLGDSSVNIEMRFWTEDPLLKAPLTSEYTEKCKLALDEAGIQIPFPHQQLLLEPSDGLDQLTAVLRGPAGQ